MTINNSVRDSASNTELTGYQAHLENFLLEMSRKSGIPGICLEVSANGARLGAAVGVLALNSNMHSSVPMTRQARFEIGNISKILLSIVVLELANRGHVNLNASLASLLNEFEGTEVGEKVSLWHLLCHGGGYRSVSFTDPEVRQAYSWEKLVVALREAPLLFAPGTVFSYSPTASALVAEIVARKMGRPAMDVVRNKLLDSLNIQYGSQMDGVDAANITVKPHGADPSTKQFIRALPFKVCDFWLKSLPDLTLSLADMVTLVTTLISSRDLPANATARIGQKVAQLMQKQMLTLPFTSGGPLSERSPLNAGLGCAEYLPNWVGYNGPFTGQSVSFRYHTTQNVALAIGMNVHSPTHCDAIAHEVLSSLTGALTLPEPITDANAPTAGELVGNYWGPLGREATIVAQGAEVICEIGTRSEFGKLRVLLGQDEFKRWKVLSNPGLISLGVFRDPTVGDPCFMIGPAAFKKVA